MLAPSQASMDEQLLSPTHATQPPFTPRPHRSSLSPPLPYNHAPTTTTTTAAAAAAAASLERGLRRPPAAMILYLCLLLHLLPRLALSPNPEVLHLLRVKLGLDDPAAVLSAWDQRDDSPCRWPAVTCDDATGNVVSVDLSNAGVAGPFPSALCRLGHLSFLSLYNNSINGALPDEVSSCRSLEHLDLAQNLLTGMLPGTLAGLPNLRHLDLSANNFSGDLPPDFGRFRRLEVLSLVYNLLDGALPPFIGNISTLRQLNVSYNPFSPSPIPPELGNLTNLEILWLTSCNLIGRIPDSLGRLKKLTDFDVAMNGLEGTIPGSLAGLASVVQIELYNNSFAGALPAGMSNLTNLRLFDAAMNQLGGTIPDELCGLPLESLNLYENKFEGYLPGCIANSPNLYELSLFSNRISGELPKDLGKNSPLSFLDISDNLFSGEMPAGLCENGALEELIAIRNSFSGSIPRSLGDCGTLKRVRLSHNRFSGEVPAGFWGLPLVYLFELAGNSFTGAISPKIAAASNLSVLLLSNNNLTGSLPGEIGRLRNLIRFSGDGNQFSGVLPPTIANLAQLEKLDLHNNTLDGHIPPGIRYLKRLNELNLANNGFFGGIPEEIGSLSNLNYLDLSQNRLSGKIPSVLQNLKLNQLNLSQNSLSGDIPSLFAKPPYESSFKGNPGLCGELCNGKSESRKRGAYILLVKSISVFAALVFIMGIGCFYRKYMNQRKARKERDGSKWTFISFHKLGFSEDEILGCLDEDNVVGSGGSGKVYRAVLSSGEAVAVKKLWGGGSKRMEDDPEEGRGGDEGFEAEVKTLGKIRHRNIVKLWCSCSSRDCKLLVYEYMPNGSLGDVLHSSKGGLLDWPTRYRIAIGAAEGLSYLHHDCVPPIVHRDVKSNNILLDGGFGARIADFGVAKIVNGTARGAVSMSVVVGSRGYIAPEYAYTLRVNEKSDTYSFGVVVLELVTGRRPIDPEFGEKDLVKWVCARLGREGGGDGGTVDPKLDSCFREEASKVLNIGLLCTSPLPINRPSMRRVVMMLQEVGGVEWEMKGVGKKDGRLTPYYHEEGSEHGIVA